MLLILEQMIDNYVDYDVHLIIELLFHMFLMLLLYYHKEQIHIYENHYHAIEIMGKISS